MSKSSSKIRYRIKAAAVDDILSNLKNCDKDFIPPLSERVNLEEYANKIFERSVTFEAWNNRVLIGLVAAYFNNGNGNFGYITNVCVENKYKGENIAKNLILRCIEYAEINQFSALILEVNQSNYSAISLYEKMNFKKINTDGQ